MSLYVCLRWIIKEDDGDEKKVWLHMTPKPVVSDCITVLALNRRKLSTSRTFCRNENETITRIRILAVLCVSALCKLQLVYYWYEWLLWVGTYIIFQFSYCNTTVKQFKKKVYEIILAKRINFICIQRESTLTNDNQFCMHRNNITRLCNVYFQLRD